jgi:hypothetical protein
MFLGRNRGLGSVGVGTGVGDAGQSTEFLNQPTRPMPAGLQRFLAKKGISSSDELFDRMQYAPRMPFRKQR